jgi:hypothetical protein
MRTKHQILTLAAVSALLVVTIGICVDSLEPSVPAIQFTFSEAAFKAVLGQWQTAGVARFKAHFIFDFPFLLSYGALGFLIASRTRFLRAFPARARALLALSLPLAASADALENALHLRLLFAQALPWEYFMAGACASTKWLLILGFVVCSAYALVRNWCSAGAALE